MSDKPKCVCGHDKTHHVLYTSDCVEADCSCHQFRPVLDWPDAVGWWWSENLDACVHALFYRVPGEIRVDFCGYAETRKDWETDGPDHFTRCEPNPFRKP